MVETFRNTQAIPYTVGSPTRRQPTTTRTWLAQQVSDTGRNLWMTDGTC